QKDSTLDGPEDGDKKEENVDSDDSPDEDDGKDENEGADDTGDDGEEDSSMTPSNEKIDNAEQKDSTLDGPAADAAERPTEESTQEGKKEQPADVAEQPQEESPQSSEPTIPPARAKVKRIEKEAVDSLMLDLTFETVRKTVTLSELKSIKPGYTFVSPNPINSPVEIRANGKLIGYGKLVSVDGNIGVQIMEFV
ncbi:MAG: FliM/FliN family flagellar motor switch protein, partial [Puniceicoccales bacterium]|nr:FliM/FliN family flagellar motor switch protein [Puniceicoccales bacterium]